MKIRDPNHRLFSPQKAMALAAEMNATDDWEYRVVHDPQGTGYSFIEIYDEFGEFVGNL